MSALIVRLWLLCCLRIGPQDLPYSARLAHGLVLIGAGLGLLVLRLLEANNGPALLVLSLALTLGVPWLVLGWRGKRERYVQTLTAFAGSGVLLSVCYLPVVMMRTTLPDVVPGVPLTQGQVAAFWLTLGFIAWQLAVASHIWRHALEWPRAGAVLLAAALFILETALGQMLTAESTAA